MKKKSFHLILILLSFSPLLSSAQSLDLSEPISKQLNLKERSQFINMPSFNVQKLIDKTNEEASEGMKPYTFAKSFDSNYELGKSGEWIPTEEGKLWQIAFSSKDAYSLNLILSNMKIPDGAVIFAYTPEYKHVAGPFTSDYNTELGILPIQPLAGEQIILEYFEPNDVKFKGTFAVTKISHDFTDILKTSQEKGFGDSGDCNVCINDSSASAWQDEKRSVALIITDGDRNCSGALINNTGSYPGRSFFLTANHCIGSPSDAAASCFMFQYENQCDGQDGSTHMIVNGSIRLANNGMSDFCLLELNTRIPSSYRPFFAGFNRSTATPSAVTSIHHPAGDVKKISIENSALRSTLLYNDNFNATGAYWRVNGWDQGIMEGGSSGSPWFDTNSRIIAQHRGGNSAGCSGSVNSWAGKFSTSWDASSTASQQLRTWLSGTGNPVTINGYSAPGWRHGWLDWNSSSNPHGSAKAIVVGEGNQVFYRRNSSDRIYTYSFSNNQWNHAQIGGSAYSHKIKGDLVVGEGNQLFYRGNDGRMQTYYWSSLNGWQHGWVDSNSNPSSRKVSSSDGAIVVGQNNTLYYKGTDSRMHTLYWTSTSGWLHGYLPSSSSNWNVAGDIAIGTTSNQIFYRGADGKMQTYYWANGQWNHDYLSTQQVNSSCGSITVGSNNSVYFRGTDDRIRILYITGNTPTSYSFGYITDWTNSTKVVGSLSSSVDGPSLYFRGYDGKMHVYYWNNGWTHDWIETSSQAPSLHSVKSGGAIVNRDGNVFYKGNDNKLHQYFYDGTGFNRISAENYAMEDVAPSPTLPTNRTSGTEKSNFIVSHIYPNPTDGQCNLAFEIQSPQKITIRIINILGKEVSVVIQSQQFDTGKYIQEIDANSLTTGTYFCVMESKEGRAVKKLLVN